MPTENIPQNGMAVSLDPSEKSFVQKIFTRHCLCAKDWPKYWDTKTYMCSFNNQVCQSLSGKPTQKYNVICVIRYNVGRKVIMTNTAGACLQRVSLGKLIEEEPKLG